MRPQNFLIACTITLSNASTCEVPKTSSFVIKSDKFTEVLDSDMKYKNQSIVVPSYIGWINISDTNWIWKDLIKVQSPDVVSFRFQFNINGQIDAGTLKVAVDDYAYVYVNEKLADSCAGATYYKIITCDIKEMLINGVNSVLFKVENKAGIGGLSFNLNIATKPEIS